MGRRRRRSRVSYRRRQKNYVPLLLVLAIVGFFFWVIFQFVVSLFSNIKSETVSADLQILSGKVEFLLPETTEWNVAFSEQTFLAGDRVRTGNNGKAAFDVFGGSTLFLDENTELEFLTLEKKSSGKKIAQLKLLKGQVWAKVSDDDFATEKDSKFEIETARLKLYVRGTVFNLTTTENQDTVRLIKGSVDVDVYDGENEPKNIKVGVGQKLIINDQTLEAVKNNRDILEIIDSEFINSEWHLQNLERFFPQEVKQIRRKIELSQPTDPVATETTEPSSDASLSSPKILQPQPNTRIPAGKDMVKLEGTAPVEAYQIEVNGYLLTKFNPGDKKWTYFGAKKFGTLVSGENTYKVVAISRDGRRSVPAEVTVIYEGSSTESNVESRVENLIQNADMFTAPVIYRPSVFLSDNTQVYQTSAPVVTIAGNVDPKTNGVEVNGFRLKKFKPGDTEFSYIANANYENMKEGENTYTIKAFGPDQKTAETTIKIHYTPIELGQ